jgi:hypothetical protein
MPDYCFKGDRLTVDRNVEAALGNIEIDEGLSLCGFGGDGHVP